MDGREDVLRELASLLAPLVAEALEGGSGRALSAAEVARRYGVDRSWVYAHAEELGAMRLGGGPRARLRFDPALVDEALRDGLDPRVRKTTRRSSRRRVGRVEEGVELLPVGPPRAVRSGHAHRHV
jgi:hypothetical protein